MVSPEVSLGPPGVDVLLDGVLICAGVGAANPDEEEAIAEVLVDFEARVDGGDDACEDGEACTDGDRLAGSA